MAYLGSVKGMGVLTVRGRASVPATYAISVYTRPGGTRFASGAMAADPAALAAAFGGGQSVLQLETGEEIDVTMSNVSGGIGQFSTKTPIPGIDG